MIKEPTYAVDRSPSVARDGNNRFICMDGGLKTHVETKRGILAIPVKQRAMDDMGTGGQGIRAGVSADMPRRSQHTRHS